MGYADYIGPSMKAFPVINEFTFYKGRETKVFLEKKKKKKTIPFQATIPKYFNGNLRYFNEISKLYRRSVKRYI